ncbi:winged helix-turn-helix transcriptional regulator [Streptomyces sp. SID10853]|uniref:MarR family winged helix-turn-helix transcriptional regulator n=1 Tax=Streptomyces sp. SID10853 TaxID=2706028 RepID=UPI0013C0CF3B|nr:MarR family winged helix-turn-helix transcriptional regulator [Streptomyces sp. SID10853]NDZ80810.1 winged helix-turn-helix transcriptional regulator [Streptomyces sp. SID10853]
MTPDTPPPALARITALPSWLLGRAAARGHRLLADSFAGEGMRLPHHVVLTAVAALGPVSQAELGRTVRIDPKDMVTVLNELQAGGLVTRTADPADRRKNAIAISPAGRTVLHRLEELGDAANDELLAPLDPSERAQLTALLTRIVHARDGSAGTER